MNKLDESQYEISLYVMLAQGELIKDIPPYVHVINKNFCDKSVLSSQGKKNLNRLILKKIFVCINRRARNYYFLRFCRSRINRT